MVYNTYYTSSDDKETSILNPEPCALKPKSSSRVGAEGGAHPDAARRRPVLRRGGGGRGRHLQVAPSVIAAGLYLWFHLFDQFATETFLQ
jgi:hypothetical protein